MSKKQLGADRSGQADPSGSERLGWFRRLRTQPGFRSATIAFVLTVVLGVGGTAAYAYWSQSASVAITGTTRSTLPADTALVASPPSVQSRPGGLTGYTCTARLTDEQMRPNAFADIRFAWAEAANATSYVITVRNTSGSYLYDKSQTVTATQADFRFERLVSDGYGKPVGSPSPFYTKYTVRVMPMNGNVPGDPLYFTYEYEHYKSDNCYYSQPIGASPLGSVAPLTCATPAFTTGPQGYSELRLSWPAAARATSYSVSMVAKNGSYGGEVTVPGTSAALRIMRPTPVAGDAAYLTRYTVRVQPMNGPGAAGDPIYLTYQVGANSHECWS